MLDGVLDHILWGIIAADLLLVIIAGALYQLLSEVRAKGAGTLSRRV